MYKAQHKTTGELAAAKMCVLDNEDDLADFTVEIDILKSSRKLYTDTKKKSVKPLMSRGIMNTSSAKCYI